MIRVSKLVNGVNFGLAEEYNPAKIFVDSKNSDVEDFGDDSQLELVPTQPILQPILNKPSLVTCQLKADIDDSNALDRLYTLCVRSKSTRIVRKNKSITPITNKLEEVHADLWGLHNLLSQSGSTYAVILMCKHICKT